MRRRKIRPSRRMPRPDRAPPLLLTLREKSDNPMQAPTERTAARPIARHCPGFKRARRRTALPEYRDKPAVFCFESSKSAALPSARAKPSFHGEARRECLRKITPGARLPATAPASSVPGAGQRSRNTRDKPAVFYSESSERRRAPRAPVPNSLFTAKPAGGLAKNHAQRRRSPAGRYRPSRLLFSPCAGIARKSARSGSYRPAPRACSIEIVQKLRCEGCDYFAAFQASICFCTSATMVSTPLAFSLSTNSSTSSLTSS